MLFPRRAFPDDKAARDVCRSKIAPILGDRDLACKIRKPSNHPALLAAKVIILHATIILQAIGVTADRHVLAIACEANRPGLVAPSACLSEDARDLPGLRLP